MVLHGGLKADPGLRWVQETLCCTHSICTPLSGGRGILQVESHGLEHGQVAQGVATRH